jgi:hypothetical protein
MNFISFDIHKFPFKKYRLIFSSIDKKNDSSPFFNLINWITFIYSSNANIHLRWWYLIKRGYVQYNTWIMTLYLKFNYKHKNLWKKSKSLQLYQQLNFFHLLLPIVNICMFDRLHQNFPPLFFVIHTKTKACRIYLWFRFYDNCLNFWNEKITKNVHLPQNQMNLSPSLIRLVMQNG